MQRVAEVFSTRSRIALRLMSVFALVMAMGVVGSVSGQNVAYAASCSYTGCNGLDPEATGCAADAVTVSSGGGTIVQLRYSRACQAYWARSSSYSTSCSVASTMRVYKFSSISPVQTSAYRSKEVCNHTSYLWTPMLGGTASQQTWFQGAMLNSVWGDTWTGVVSHKTCNPCAVSVDV